MSYQAKESLNLPTSSICTSFMKKYINSRDNPERKGLFAALTLLMLDFSGVERPLVPLTTGHAGQASYRSQSPCDYSMY